MVTRTKKIFVGGLSAPTTLEDVKSYFEQFGPVSNVLLKFIRQCQDNVTFVLRENINLYPSISTVY